MPDVKNTPSTSIMVVDLKKIKPDPTKIESEKKQAMVLNGIGIGAIGGMAGYLISDLASNSAKPPHIAASVIGSIIGAIVGVYTGSQYQSYEEKAYKLLEEANKDPSKSAEVIQRNLAYLLKSHDDEIAMQEAMHMMSH